ncbi:glycosyltransferase family 1 protein [Stenotrophomonas maltophilia]|nr:glycosyltransferase family 1 protein [Stenotrophomonas maltophilia]
MKVLLVHNAYQVFGGEDSVVSRERSLLARSGHTVATYEVSNNSISGLGGRVRAALGTVFSVGSYFAVTRAIREFQPEVVHVHNFFPLISPSVFYACKRERVPVVFTLHNYRILCPTATLEYDGEVVLKSLKDGPWWALRQRVFQGSLAGTFVLCSMIYIHARMGTWNRMVDRFITPSETSRRNFLEGGLPSHRLAVKPHFVEIDEDAPQPRSGFLYVGRLSAEKGVSVLLRAIHALAHSSPSIGKDAFCIVGGGPMEQHCLDAGVHSLGAMQASGVQEMMRSATALIVPSVCQETFGLVIIEAYACGLPVIASRIGAFEELVVEGQTGLTFEAGNAEDLAAKIKWAAEHPLEMMRMGSQARSRYVDRYTAERNINLLVSIYREAAEEYRT